MKDLFVERNLVIKEEKIRIKKQIFRQTFIDYYRVRKWMNIFFT